jgi:hypothetical protein
MPTAEPAIRIIHDLDTDEKSVRKVRVGHPACLATETGVHLEKVLKELRPAHPKGAVSSVAKTPDSPTLKC